MRARESRVSNCISQTICRRIFRRHRCWSISRDPRVSDRRRCLRWRTEYRWWPVASADCRRSFRDCENGILTDNEPTAIAAAIRRALDSAESAQRKRAAVYRKAVHGQEHGSPNDRRVRPGIGDRRTGSRGDNCRTIWTDYWQFLERLRLPDAARSVGGQAGSQFLPRMRADNRLV